jgi:N4-(beta-N-acetylglucosaminyl)-L-asparaginase
MKTQPSRRTFLSAGAASLATLAIGAEPVKKPGGKRPVVVATPNGVSTVKRAMERLRAGADPLDAAIEAVAAVEADPNDHSIGRGGFPNAEGVVELDAMVMHGKYHASGAVAALRNIIHPAAVARAVMQKTRNCLLVGDGALKFAKDQGFPETDLLTKDMKKVYETWKKAVELERDGKPVPKQDMEWIGKTLGEQSWLGAMYCLTLDSHGDLAGLATSPGGALKIPGRVGDTPIIGAGLYVDNEVGACTTTGYGEFTLLNCSCYQVVENLRNGMLPEAACLDACKRIVKRTSRNPHFRDEDGKLIGSVTFYCLTKNGEFGGATLGQSQSMIVHDGKRARTVKLVSLRS